MIKSSRIDLDSRNETIQDVFSITTKALIVAIEASRDIRFHYYEDLLYYIDNNGDDYERLCISKFMKFEIFKQVHDYMHHDEFHRTYNRLYYSIYVRNIIKHLRNYIAHCLECQLN